MTSLISDLFSAFLFIYFVRGSLGVFFIEKRKSSILRYGAWLVFLSIEISGTQIITSPIYILCFNVICELVLVMVLYEGSLRRKILWVIAINLAAMLSELIVGYFFILLSIDIAGNAILGSFISKILLVFSLQAFKAYNHLRFKKDIPVIYWIAILIVPLGSVIILHTIFLYTESTEDNSYAISALLSTGVLMVINILTLSLYERILDRLEIKKQQVVFNNQIELYKRQIQEIEKSVKELHTLKHDSKNHLLCVKKYMESQEYDQAENYINNLLNIEGFGNNLNQIKSGNMVLDALLNYKNRIMADNGIAFEANLEVPQTFSVEDADLCVVLGNCLDNAIEAVSKIPYREGVAVKEKRITLKIILRKNTLFINIQNPFWGNLIRDNQGNYITTKVDAENHGLGMESVKRAIQKYDGQMVIETINSRFDVHIMLYCLT
ncbi:MAG: GHKL domain-containing protein [Lachnospiraceae bacterium]|jgi:sensor histidine kinase YesM|nr:GHKL domain-containing protein [Lachnospiraceae bacterium]